jgi:glycosyltransferase involved in cell wall biosynthesis
MKILHLTNNLGSGGSEKLLTDILPMMQEKGHQVHLAYANSAKNVKVYDEILQEAQIRIINFKLSTFSPLLLLKLIRLLRREKYDIVHAHIFPTQYWLALAAYFKPGKTVLLKTEHNVFNNRRSKKQLRKLERFIYQRYAAVIAITAEVAGALETWLDNDRQSVVIENGVNLKQMERARQKNEKPAVFKAEHFNVLMTGRFLGGAKDQKTLIQALRLLPEHFHVYFAGDGPLMPEAKQLVKELQLQSRAHFLGLCSNVYELMSQVDLNVLSTRYEGLSGVTLEGLASGKPFIGADVFGVNNIVPDSRFLFPAQQPEALAGKIVSIAQDPALAAAMVKTSLAHIQRYDISNMVHQYLELYEKHCQS